ncbi:MAG: prolyl oligopeptidase family serine peptidase [Acidimicrobiales bacterium]|nr:prolyl oligopeptidase family serine peptidase [Acidimicrobiales bacterium]
MPVADPYRWLEDGTSGETRAWVRDHNARTRAVLDGLPRRAAIHDHLTGLLRAGSSVGCQVAGDLVFSLERWGHHDQAVLVARPANRPGEPVTLVDPRAQTNDRTAAIDWFHPSPDGRRVAYGVSTGGDERSALHVLDLDRSRRLRDRIPWTRACSVAWLPDGSAFAYTRFPDPAGRPTEEHLWWRRVFWHRVGEDWRHDELVWDELPDPTAWPNVSLSPDGRWLLVHQAIGWRRVDVHLVDRATGARIVLVDGIEAVSSFTVVGDRIVGLTTLDAPRGRIVTAPLARAWHDEWRTIVPESERVLEAVVSTSRSLIVLSSLRAVSGLDRYDHDGSDHRALVLPELGSLAGLTGSRDRDEAFFSFTSFTTPPTLMRWTPDGVRDWSHLRELDGPGTGPQGRYEVDQVRFPSFDGTPVSMFLIRADDTVPGPDTPCVLTAYGGFAVTLGPSYSAAVVDVCDRGGLYAVANVRGGGEEGEAWHAAGMGPHRRRSIGDLLAAADHLVERVGISRQRLALRGGSNGGLLVGAAIARRPDVCRVAQLAVPLTDMVRYHRFLVARLWVPEYGDPDDPEAFRWLLDYSPYHRITDDRCYPAVLLTTAESDTRVDPLHARKLTARLQAASSCGETRPILLREEARAGHGQGKPMSLQADELADVLAFLDWQLT